METNFEVTEVLLERFERVLALEVDENLVPQLQQRFGGLDMLTVYSDGDRPNASADAAPIKAMEAFERQLKTETNLGASVSLAYQSRVRFGSTCVI